MRPKRNHTDSFISSLKPGEVIDRFEELSQEKGWKIKSRDEHGVEAKQSPNFFAWGEHIEVSADETPEGTKVHLVVNLSRPQLVDWGEGSSIEREVRSRLGGFSPAGPVDS